MLDKVLGQDIPAGLERQNFLRDNCDSVEMLDYTKELNEERRNELKESLVDKNIQLRDVRADKRAADELYKEQDKAYKNKSSIWKAKARKLLKHSKKRPNLSGKTALNSLTKKPGLPDITIMRVFCAIPVRFVRTNGREPFKCRFAAPEQKAKEKPIINLLNH